MVFNEASMYKDRLKEKNEKIVEKDYILMNQTSKEYLYLKKEKKFFKMKLNNKFLIRAKVMRNHKLYLMVLALHQKKMSLY